MTGIRNVVVFVADGLRWDFTPRNLKSMGVCFKTVSHSLYSPPSFTSISTGLYPQQHGVHHWSNVVPEDVKTIYDIQSVETCYHNEDPDDRLYKTLRVERKRGLEDLEPPFLYLERDITPHFPYRKGCTDSRYFGNNSWSQIQADYRERVQECYELFKSRLDVLRRRGLLEDTLVVFTSDHGELFGEHGGALHVAPACPELVYVPTVFINPELSSDDFHADPSCVIEHVDVVETLLSAIDSSDRLSTMGTDIFSQARNNSWGYNHVSVERKGFSFYRADSLWWRDGGHSFIRNSRLGRMAYLAYLMVKSKARRKARRDSVALLGHYLRNEHSYGSPPVPRTEAQELVRDVVTGMEAIDSETVELDDEARKRLEDLGYLT